ELSRKQMEALAEHCRREGIPLHQIGSRRQGIVHVIGPELGLTQPGMVIVCGDSHTSTHGAFGALAFGIGTSEVELVLATQCLPQRRPRDLAVNVEGSLPTEPGHVFDEEIQLDAGSLVPFVTWGTNPGQVVPITGRVPAPGSDTDARALRYMDLRPGTAIADITIDRVFIGSCTNARLED